MPHSLRYFLYLRYIKNNLLPDDVVLLCDIRDVVFQSNHFPYAEINSINFFLEDKSKNILNCKYNSYWIKYAYGEPILRKIGYEKISCSGVTIGLQSSMEYYLSSMINHLKKITPIGGIDQGVHNYLIHSKLMDIKYSLIDDDCNLVSTISYFKPRSKIKLNWSFKVVNISGEVIPIVHQYDRSFRLLYIFNKPLLLRTLYNLLKAKVVSILKYLNFK
jgi:hypothetical protein